MTASIRRLHENELAVVQPLFKNVFRHPISLDLLRWKYSGDNGESWIVEESAGGLKPIVHIGFFFRDILHCGDKIRAAQVVDLMAAPKTRGLTRYDSPFAALLRTILTNLASPANPAGIAFGVPADRAGKLALSLGLAHIVDHLSELEFQPVQNKPHLRWRTIGTSTESDAPLLNSLWSAMRNDLKDHAIGIRDSAYITKRYIKHPENDYTLLLFESRWLRRPVGLVVIGPNKERREILDIVCSLQHAPDVIAALQAWQDEHAPYPLYLSLTRHFSELLRPLAASCVPTEFRIMGNPFTPHDSLVSYENRWWLTGGDTDYR